MKRKNFDSKYETKLNFLTLYVKITVFSRVFFDLLEERERNVIRIVRWKEEEREMLISKRYMLNGEISCLHLAFDDDSISIASILLSSLLLFPISLLYFDFQST